MSLLGQKGVLGRSEPQLLGRAPITGRAYGRNPGERWRRLARKAGSGWVSGTGGGKLGNVSGQTPGTPWGRWQEGVRHGEKSLKLYHQRGGLLGWPQPCMGLKGQKDLRRMWLGVGSSHITQEHLKGFVLACASATGSWGSHNCRKLCRASAHLSTPHFARSHIPPW